MRKRITVETFTPEELKIQNLWTALQVADKQQEKRGIQFGQACYELRNNSYHVRGIGGFEGTLEKLSIPVATAYRWIARWEEHIGTRPPKPTEPEIIEPEPEEPKPEPTLTPEERDRRQLGYLVKRVHSLAKALKGLNDSRWSKHPEYAAVVQATTTLKGVLDTL